MKRLTIIAAAGLAGFSFPENPAAQDQQAADPQEVAGESSTAATGAENAAARNAWTNDYGAARKRAIAEKKDLLLVFTGSDWIQLCSLYDRDILFQPDFINAISEHFVPVRFDFPKGIKTAGAQKARQQLMMRAYRVAAFPTLVLTDSEGRPYGINGYQPVTPAEYGKVVQAMKETRIVRDDLFAKSAQAEGIEKARLLAKAIPKLPGSLAARFYRPELEEIIALDPDNETGKVPVCKKLIADVDYSNEMEKLQKDVQWSKMIELTDAYIRDQDFKGAELQQALLNKVGVYRDQANHTEMARTLLQIVKIDESTPHARNAKKILDGMRTKVLEEQLTPPK